MRHHLTVKGDLDADRVRGWLERPLGRLGRKLERFPRDAVHLQTLVRNVEGRARSEASVTLRLPSRTLAASEAGADPRIALYQAFAELERALEKEKARLRRAGAWRRSSQRFQQELVGRAEERAERALSDTDARELRRRIHELEVFVRRELRWLEASGELVPGEIDARDVIDAAFERAFARGRGKPSRQQLLRSAAAALRAELSRVRAARLELHIEEEAPRIPPQEQVSTLGSEIYEFHQPDDELRVEDLVPGLARTPEELEATSELAEVLREALAALPARWRQAFELHQAEGLDELEIARTLDVDRDEVPRLLENARAFLRDRLVEVGALAPETRRAPRDRGA